VQLRATLAAVAVFYALAPEAPGQTTADPPDGADDASRDAPPPGADRDLPDTDLPDGEQPDGDLPDRDLTDQDLPSGEQR
jgi:hypothetical protein